MKIASHDDKIRRLSALRLRLDPLRDFELWYWTTLTAGTNIWNATLHAAGLTSEERVFSTIPGVHVVPQPDGSLRRELRGPGDVSHVGWPPIPGEMPRHLHRLEAALHALEAHRDPCLRGDREPTQTIVDECERAFAEAIAVYQHAIR
ncbi:hypothetical protein [Variovorax sp. YR216]|uniref:hypothetical protein n=1 Tax=Variovorax sp. YR216 TaxID=1882828 RepID=UPI00089A5BD8|nr:hypothetical protein [Variovorax sp. YR216]SEB22350.1 hypothetical protein SAMN05444680_1169 [Variovorax sp. YR216]